MSPATLTFTPTNWNVEQWVTVTGVDDSVDQSSDRSVTISHSAISRDASYNSIAIAAVPVTVVDNDSAGVSIMASNGSTAVTEAAGAGRTDTYTVVLDTEPRVSVTIEVTSGDEGAAIVSPATLTFTPANWNRMQTVTVTGVDDSVDQGSDRSVAISHTATSRDASYNRIAIAAVLVTVVDNDGAGVSVIASNGSTAVTEAAGAGRTDTYTVMLNTRPTSNVDIAVLSSDEGAATVSPATLIFTPANWNRMQTVTVTGVDDRVDQGNRSVTITHTASSSDANYRTISIPSVVATVADNDTAAVTIAESGDIPVTEATGADHTATYTVVLATLPSASVEIAIESDDPGAATVSPATLIFTPANWNRMQTVTVTGVDDSVDQGNRSVTITHTASSSDANYRTISIPSVVATVVDNDTAAVTITESGDISVTEATGADHTATYTVVLATLPSASVEVAIESDDPGAATVSPATLTFAPTNWNRMQTVTVTGVNDNVDQQVNRSATIGHSSVSYDPAYDGISIPSVSVTVVAADSVAKEAWHLRLGRTVSHQVVDALQDRLAARPAAGLQVTVAGEAITDTPPLVENQGILSKAMGFEVVSPEALVEGSSFSFAPEGTEGGPQVALWGQGALSSFRGEQDNISLDGDVTTLLLGADWTGHRWQAGAALSQSWGHGSYGEDNDGEGEISNTVTGLFPYGRYALTPRLGLWATAGYGWGQLTLKPDDTEDEYKPSTTLAVAALGIDGLLRDGGSEEGITLRGTADVLTVKTTSEEVDGLASSEGSLSRLRLGLEAVGSFPLANGSSLLPSMELGIRQDSGPASAWIWGPASSGGLRSMASAVN